jgi:tetratricopeptide (TPR) repeat protein
MVGASESSRSAPRSNGKPGDKSRGGKPGDKSRGGKPGDKSRGGKPGDKSRGGKPGDKSRGGKPGDKPRSDRPRIPDDITGKEIDRRVAAELRTLPEELGTTVARLLVAASRALEAGDLDLAVAYANEAKRLAGRVSVVREAAGIAAYSVGDYATALAELRAVRRMTGDQDFVPIMADCERGLGRPRKALELLAEAPESQLSDSARIEARIVEAGARRDLGQPEAALLLLQVPQLNARRTEDWLARLRYAYADTLAELGRLDDARTWFERAAQVDPEGATDAEERVAELDGITFEDSWSEDGDDDQRLTEAASPEVDPGPSV